MTWSTIRNNMKNIDPPRRGKWGSIKAPETGSARIVSMTARIRLNQITDGAYGGQLGRCIETEFVTG